MTEQSTLDTDVERMHRVDPEDWSWNESWFLSWVDSQGGPSGVFRIGITPNQPRAMLWCFVHVGDTWYTVEESRLALGDFDLSHAVAYDKWGLRFATVENWDAPVRGWFEASRYGVA